MAVNGNTQTETYESLKIYIDMDLDGLQKLLMQMFGGMKCGIDIGTFQNDMINIKNRDDVLTLELVMQMLYSFPKKILINRL